MQQKTLKMYLGNDFDNKADKLDKSSASKLIASKDDNRATDEVVITYDTADFDNSVLIRHEGLR